MVTAALNPIMTLVYHAVGATIHLLHVRKGQRPAPLLAPLSVSCQIWLRKTLAQIDTCRIGLLNDHNRALFGAKFGQTCVEALTQPLVIFRLLVAERRG